MARDSDVTVDGKGNMRAQRLLQERPDGCKCEIFRGLHIYAECPMYCQDCNYTQHQCMGCGDDLTHDQGRACDDCRTTGEADKETTMDNIFKSVKSDLQLVVEGTREGHVRFTVHVSGHPGHAIDLSRGDAAPIMLAIGEAAGVSPWYGPEGTFEHGSPEHLSYLLQGLRKYQDAQRVEERKLEAEALELVNAWMDSCGAGKYPSWAHVETGRREQGLAVARKAREMRSEK